MTTYLGTETLKLEELIPFPGNAQRGDIPKIRESIREHGQYRSLVVRRTAGGDVILAGNHTARALVAEGFAEARCEIIECTEAQAIKINLGDNRLAALGSTDDDALAELLEMLNGDLTGTGYTEEDYSYIQSTVGGNDEETPDLDKLAEDLGDPVDSDLWPTLRFKVPPQVRDDFYDLTNNCANPNDDNNRFMHLIQKVRSVA